MKTLFLILILPSVLMGQALPRYNSTGVGITNSGSKLNLNVVAGSNITLTTGNSGQVSISSSGSGGTAGTVINTGASVSGYVPVYSDTTGTNVAPVNVTGTGAIVKSSAPTLTNLVNTGTLTLSGASYASTDYPNGAVVQSTGHLNLTNSLPVNNLSNVVFNYTITDSAASVGTSGFGLRSAGAGAGVVWVDPNILTKHITINGPSSPTIVTNAGAGNSTGTVTLDANASDTCGLITLNTGSSPVSGGVILTLTFNTPFSRTPKVFWSGNNAIASLAARTWYWTATTTTFTLTDNSGIGALAASSQYLIAYWVVE